MQIKFASVMVDDQSKALKFYTEVLGFAKQADLPAGEHRWLTVSAPDGVEGAELVLEPMDFAPSRSYQKSLFEAGMPVTAFMTGDIEREYARLRRKGVVFRDKPQVLGPIKSALFEDTCGNLINLVQPLD